MSRFLITTSWDDGYPLDLRLADLLWARGIQATFYVPRCCDRPVVGPAELRRLSNGFEIGAHTLTHCDLTQVAARVARAEIGDSKDWVEQITGKTCKMFCFPGGKFRPEHLRWVWEAGYTGCRTVELLSVEPPGYPPVLATSVQAFPHSMTSYGRNLAKRLRLARLWKLLALSPARDWVRLSGILLQEAERSGGVFHLWGHSWEFESDEHWKALAAALDHMQAYRDSADLFTNGQVCAAAGYIV